MKEDLIQPAATIVAALIASEGVRTGVRPSTKELLVHAYRALEAAMDQIREEDQQASGRQVI